MVVTRRRKGEMITKKEFKNKKILKKHFLN